jgi:cytochrome c oxidase subunit I+III
LSESDVLDASRLPDTGFGPRSCIFWGVLILIAIESTAFVLLFATFLYLRGNSELWPPEGVRSPDLVYPIAGTLVLLSSLLPLHWSSRAALAADPPGIRRWLVIATLPGILFCVLRAIEFAELPFTWYDHAYGSAFWTVIGLHSIHAVTGVCENLYLVVVILGGTVERKHLVDVRASNLYWYFMVLSWVPLFGLLYGERLL